MANKKDKIEIYASRKVKGQYGWRYVSSNGRKMADGCELYHNKKDVEKAIEKLRKAFATAPLADTTKPAKLKEGDKVVLTDGDWKGINAVILYENADGNYRVMMTDRKLKGYTGTWPASGLKLAPAKAKRITKAIKNPVK